MKVNWSFTNLFLDTPKEVENIRNGFMIFAGGITTTAYLQTNTETALITAGVCGAINWLLGGFKLVKNTK